MILIYTLKNNFTNNAIISVDSSISIQKEIKIGDFYVFCDNNFNVNSINITNAKKYEIDFDKNFYVLNNEKWANIRNAITEKNDKLIFSNFTKFQYGKITKREQHPKSTKLFLVTILTNKNDYSTVTLVTNTLDSTEGKIVVFANKGSVTVSGLRVVENEILGIKSVGMLVGYKTLGLEGKTLIFGDEDKVGKEFLF